MEELNDLSVVIRNLFQARAFFLASDQSRKEKTAEALEGSVRQAINTADGLAYSLVHSNAEKGKIMSKEDSQSLVDYQPLRRDVVHLLDPEEVESESKEVDEETEAEASA